MIPRLEVLAIVQKIYIKMAQRQKRPWTIWMPKNDVVLPFYSFFSYFCTELFCEVGIPAENFTFWFHVIQNELLYIYYCQKNENIRVEINRENIMKFWLSFANLDSFDRKIYDFFSNWRMFFNDCLKGFRRYRGLSCVPYFLNMVPNSATLTNFLYSKFRNHTVACHSMISELFLAQNKTA